MATLSSNSVEKALKTFSASLEDLTFNSKPIIDELTRFASSYRQSGAQIVQRVEERILEVRPEWKLPSLYLLDSILKNIKGDYLLLFSKNIVHIFCHCFEKLVDPEPRKALYKLRQTWPPYFPNRKLALIDKHIKALDPNWPVTAVEKDPPSPTIFVNPKFLEPNDTDKQASSQTPSTEQRSEKSPVKDKEVPPKTKKEKPSEKQSKKSPSKASVSPPAKDTRKVKEETMTIQEKRRKLLQEKQSQRIKQQEAMGISTDNHLKPKKRSGKSRTPPGSSRRSSPLKVQSPRARSVSPLTVATKRRSASPQVNSLISRVCKEAKDNVSKETAPPPEKRSKLETDSESELIIDIPNSDPPSSKNKEDSTLIKEAHLQLNDIPPELLPKHHELILKQIETQLDSGSLTSEQHDTLCKQLDQLYKLQKQKVEEEGSVRVHPPKTEVEQSNKGHTDNSKSENSIPSEEFISLSDNSNADSAFFVDTRGSNDNFDFGPTRRSGRHDHRGRPRTHFEPPREDRYYSRHPPRGPYRDDFRPPFRTRRGQPHPPRRPRGNRGRYFDEREGPPPPVDSGRVSGHRSSGPPPPHWHEPPPSQGGGYGMPPVHGPVQPPPQIEVSQLFSKLVDFGIIGGNEDSSTDGNKFGSGSGTEPQITSAPVTVPTLAFTPATLKQRYSALVSLLHVGEQCSTCGVRFMDRSGEEYKKHLDWHYNLNKEGGERQAGTSRNWFVHPEDWLKFEELSEEPQEKEPILKPSGDTQEEREGPTPTGEIVTSCQVLTGEGNEVCTICHEPLEEFWEEDLEEWHFKDTTRGSSGKLYHTFCFQDAKEDDLNNSNNSAQTPSSEIKY